MQRLLGLLLITTALAAVDLWVKLALPTPEWALHQRSNLWFIGSCLLLVAALPLAKLPSNTVTVAAGIFNGGVLGNVLSASNDHLVVPNPILIGNQVNGVAFNLADLFILTGNLMLMATLIVLVIRNRDRLPKSSPVLRRLRRRRASA
jgi:protein-S-isoprenylcysteine O-methyltransferase Ste14